MTGGTNAKETLKVLIAVKTYPIPSAKYDELVCTAGVTERGDFIRLYPINFRDLPFSRQYRKYQWIEVRAEKHRGRDVRKESYRPDCATIRILGKPISTNPGNWSERARYVLAKKRVQWRSFVIIRRLTGLPSAFSSRKALTTLKYLLTIPIGSLASKRRSAKPDSGMIGHAAKSLPAKCHSSSNIVSNATILDATDTR
jgi:hypothetical protein